MAPGRAGAATARTRAKAAKARPDPPGLSREQIVETALRLIDEAGLDGFSLREVARLLGVYPTALYWHLPGGRNTLLAEAAAAALGDVAQPFRTGDDWAEWIRGLFQRYRDNLRRHPNVAPLLGAQLVSNAGVNPQLVEQVLAALEAAGFAGDRLVDAYNAVIAAMLGYVTLELAPKPSDDPTGWASAFEGKIRSLSPSDYPRLTGNLDRLANRAFIVRWQGGVEVPLTSGFDFYVEAFIAGLRAQIPD
ncbi:TetR/AcrR family transcriptional regulator [Phreatobacter stygius]|uniref:TetR family transcriptional regulator n=1 Tax=Phreatobacter stygius TaxID=1940610 RepID=A0A4D7BE72_9HYPH|nr:TetR/AcrR family transcriptional regulator C-terminal domain-containing protein [Phreatobacter stygius]QCI66282.1 TetR family transcriptional regulator [Phreatobacter stygius]